jgi:hypothetical protein
MGFEWEPNGDRMGYTVGPPNIAKLMQIIRLAIGFVVIITIGNGVYKRTNIIGGGLPCRHIYGYI